MGNEQASETSISLTKQDREDWFKVEEHDGIVRVVSDDMATREGPALTSTDQGLWGFAPEPKQPEDLKQAAAIVASFAYNAAMREQSFPRKVEP